MLNDSIERAANPLWAAQALANKSPTLAGMIREKTDLPMGWLVDLPESVLNGRSLPPAAKEIFWLLARSSFQLSRQVMESGALDGTAFHRFLQEIPLAEKEAHRHWRLVRPATGFEFLIQWLLDPAYVELGTLARRLLASTAERVVNTPEEFVGRGLDLEFLTAEHIERRQEEEAELLNYFIRNGATKEMVEEYFPHAPTEHARFRPGRITAIDLKTDQFRLYKTWSRICGAIYEERQRLAALHREFPDYSMASLYHAIHCEG